MNPPLSPQAQRRTILLLVLVTLAPVILATFAYYFWKPDSVNSYGQLLAKPIPLFALTQLDGKPSTLDRFKGKWLLLMADGGACNISCQDTLYALQQFRLAQGPEMDRIERAWLVTDGVKPNVQALGKASDTTILFASTSIPLLGDVTTGIYLIDPLGNQVMRYERNLALQPLASMPLPALRKLDGSLSPPDRFRGKWIVLMVDDAHCGRSCDHTLEEIGKFRPEEAADAIERVWVATGVAAPGQSSVDQARTQGIDVLRTSEPLALPGDVSRAYYVINPQGTILLRYVRSSESKKVIKEIGNILKNNQAIG